VQYFKWLIYLLASLLVALAFLPPNWFLLHIAIAWAAVGISIVLVFFILRFKEQASSLLLDQTRIRKEKSALLDLATSSCFHSGDLTRAAEALAKTSATTLNVERVSVWQFDQNYTSISCLRMYKLSSNGFSDCPVLAASVCPEYFEAIRNSRVVVINDTVRSPLTKEFAYVHQEKISSMVDAPFHVNGRLMGIVCHEQVGPSRIWSIDEQNFAASIADMMSRAYQASEKIKVEKQLKDTCLAIEASIDGIAVLDRSERYIYVNRAHAKTYGYSSPEELLGQSWRVLYSEEELKRFENLHMPQFRACGSLRVEATGKRKDGSLFPQMVSLTQVEDGRFICVCQDITDQKKLQGELLQSHKMEAIGQLAGGIAHDFNNLLTGILGYTGLLKAHSKGDAEVSNYAQLIENAAGRASELTQKLLGFARKGKHQNVIVDLHQLVNETFPLLSRTIEKNITISTSLSAESAFIQGDPVQIQQMILNLAINARDAMSLNQGGCGGLLTFATRIVDFNPANPPPSRELKFGKYLEFSVSDTGIGIDAENLSKIFEPFFTTKEAGKGTGMGLAMVYGIVRSHAGAIIVESVPKHGSCFKVYLPSSAPNLEAQVQSSQYQSLPQAPLGGKANILLVDDHALMRDATSRMLSSLGYKVVTAKDGVEALEYFREHSQQVDLVIIDMVMPRMGAKECLKQLKLINPRLKAILSTGYVNNHLVQDILNDGVQGFLQKPFQLSHLSSAIVEVLNQTETNTSVRMEADQKDAPRFNS